MNQLEKRELLEEYAHEYLYELFNSQPICQNEKPSVYISEGKLLGLSRVFNISFEVKLRRKISFYKQNGKLWFEVVNESLPEEEAKEMIQSNLREWGKQNQMLRNL